MEVIFVAALIALAVSNLCIWFTLWKVYRWHMETMRIMYALIGAKGEAAADEE